jgi:hypothetical protein
VAKRLTKKRTATKTKVKPTGARQARGTRPAKARATKTAAKTKKRAAKPAAKTKRRAAKPAKKTTRRAAQKPTKAPPVMADVEQPDQTAAGNDSIPDETPENTESGQAVPSSPAPFQYADPSKAPGKQHRHPPMSLKGVKHSQNYVAKARTPFKLRQTMGR